MESSIIVPIIVAIIASTGFWSFLQGVIQTRKSRKSINRKALLALLHDKLYYLCHRYLSQGYITPDEFENLNYLYTPYAEMGGNGVCEHLFNQVKKLPVKPQEGIRDAVF